MMWMTRTFKTREAFHRWIKRNGRKTQWQEIFINNGYGVEYRKLRKVY